MNRKVVGSPNGNSFLLFDFYKYISPDGLADDRLLPASPKLFWFQPVTVALVRTALPSLRDLEPAPLNPSLKRRAISNCPYRGTST